MRLREGVLAGILVAVLQSGAALAQEVPPPDDRVAQVGSVAISRVDFDHWFAAASRSQYERPVEMVGPGYEQCTAVKRKLRATRGWRKLDERELRARCARDHHELRRQVMQFLVQSQWVEQEAAAAGVVVTEQRVRQIFKRQKRAAFPNERGYQRFLRKSGATEADILYRIRLDAVQNRLTRHVTRQAKPVTARDVARYRARHPRPFKGMGTKRANRVARRLLHAVREQVALGRFVASFRKRYRAKTWCADGYAVAECGAIAPPS